MAERRMGAATGDGTSGQEKLRMESGHNLM
jgi:hypothetical protein